MGETVFRAPSIENVTADFTVNSSYVSLFTAQRYNRNIYVAFRIKTGVPNNATIVTIPSSHSSKLNDFYFSGVDANNNSRIAPFKLTGNSIIYMGQESTTEYFGSVQYLA